MRKSFKRTTFVAAVSMLLLLPVTTANASASASCATGWTTRCETDFIAANHQHAARGGASERKGAAESTRSITLSLAPDAGAGISPAFSQGGGVIACSFSASENYYGSGDNVAAGYVFCSAIEDAIFFDFYWYRHNTATLLKFEPTVPDHETNSSIELSDYDSFEFLDVYVCVTVVKSGFTNAGDCVAFYGV